VPTLLAPAPPEPAATVERERKEPRPRLSVGSDGLHDGAVRIRRHKICTFVPAKTPEWCLACLLILYCKKQITSITQVARIALKYHISND
jgi:hypothetical protein